MKSVSRRIIRADRFQNSFPFKISRLPSSWAGISPCVRARTWLGCSGIRSTLVEGASRRVPPAEIRAFVLLFGSLGIVYHGSGLPRISEIPRATCPPPQRIRARESRSRRFAATVKYLHALNRARYSGHSIIWNKSRPFPSIEGNSDRNLFQVLKNFEKWIDYVAYVYRSGRMSASGQ